MDYGVKLIDVFFKRFSLFFSLSFTFFLLILCGSLIGVLRWGELEEFTSGVNTSIVHPLTCLFQKLLGVSHHIHCRCCRRPSCLTREQETIWSMMASILQLIARNNLWHYKGKNKKKWLCELTRGCLWLEEEVCYKKFCIIIFIIEKNHKIYYNFFVVAIIFL